MSRDYDEWMHNKDVPDAGDEPVEVGEFAATVAAMLRGELGDRYATIHGWEIVGLDIGEVEIRTRTLGNFRLIVQPLSEVAP